MVCTITTLFWYADDTCKAFCSLPCLEKSCKILSISFIWIFNMVWVFLEIFSKKLMQLLILKSLCGTSKRFYKGHKNLHKTFFRFTMPMATKLGRMVTYFERLQLSIRRVFNHLVSRSHDKLKLLYIHYHNAYGYQTGHGEDRVQIFIQ